MLFVGLCNVPASVREANDSSREQAEVGKQNKTFQKRRNSITKFDRIQHFRMCNMVLKLFITR